MRFARMLLAGGSLDGVRIVGRQTLAMMTSNHLPGGVDLPQLSRSMFSEAAYSGVGFGLGFATTLNPAQTLTLGSVGDFFWGGAASTFFVVDPREDMVMALFTQLIPSSSYPLRRQLRALVHAAL
jgi:CubicO group peptidase (beta-lactamase class C family)